MNFAAATQLHMESNWLPALALIAGGYLLGAVPFSVWLGRLALRGADVRAYGDGNPGAVNALKAGGPWLGLLVLLLDVSKAAAPAGYAYHNLGMRGWPVLLVALAPALGHAWSPFLGWRGGKALTTVLGAWIGFSYLEMPAVVLGAAVLFLWLTKSPAWGVTLAGGVGLGYLLVFHRDPLWVALMLAHLALIAWKHRAGLSAWPKFRAPGKLDAKRTSAPGE